VTTGIAWLNYCFKSAPMQSREPDLYALPAYG